MIIIIKQLAKKILSPAGIPVRVSLKGYPLRGIELIKLVYTYNPEGKGKQRKRTLEEILDYINDPNQ